MKFNTQSRVEAGYNTPPPPTVALLVVRGLLVSGGNNYGDLSFEFGGASFETVTYGYRSRSTWTIE